MRLGYQCTFCGQDDWNLEYFQVAKKIRYRDFTCNKCRSEIFTAIDDPETRKSRLRVEFSKETLVSGEGVWRAG